MTAAAVWKLTRSSDCCCCCCLNKVAIDNEDDDDDDDDDDEGIAEHNTCHTGRIADLLLT